MTYDSTTLIATIDVRQRDTLRLGLLRVMFPAFAEEIELGRYIRRLLREGGYPAVHLEPHRDAEGQTSPHVFDVFAPTPPNAVPAYFTQVARSSHAS